MRRTRRTSRVVGYRQQPGTLVASVSALVAGVVAVAIASAPANAGPTLPLNHAGRWITDAQGRVVILHGVNMVSKKPPYAPDANGFSEDDAAFLESEGYNTVRLGLIYKAVEPQPGHYDDAYIDRIKATADMLARHGIVSLLDFHQDLYNERFQGEGWPDWAVNDDGLPAQPALGFPYNYLLMPALQRAFDHFWANDPAPGDSVGLQDRYAAAWHHVAERFRGDNAVLGFDLLNEPWPGTLWQQCANPIGCPVFDATMSQFIQRTIAAIRQADPTTLAFYEPNVIFNYGAATNVADTGDAHAGMSFHDYCLAHDATGQPLGCDVFDDLVFQNAESHTADTDDTSLLTEFGATPDPVVLSGMTARADRFMVGWQFWHYCACDDPTTSGPGATQAMVVDPHKPPEGSNVDTGKMKLLSRAYAQVIAGTPTTYAFTGDRFTLTYSTTRADANGPLPPYSETDIVMPARQYPNGYGVLVKGGTILSAPGARVLRIGACPGADTVGVAAESSHAFDVECTAPPSVAAAVTKLRVSVSPKTVHAGRRVRLRFTVKAGAGRLARPVKGATVTLAGAKAKTSSTGQATIRKRFRRAGKRTATVRAPGFASARVVIRVRR
jgi:endoglycosylceramidase